MHHQNEFLVFVFLVIAIRTCHTYPRPQNVESPVVDVAKETEYEEHRDAELQESINAGQSGRALLFPYNGILAIELNDRPKRQDDEQATSSETTTEQNAEEIISESKLPESYAGRFEGLNIGNILSIAGAKPQAFTRGEASYGRKRRNSGDDDAEKVEAKNEEIPVAMADQMTEIENVQALWLEFLQHGISSRRKRQEEAKGNGENVETKNVEIPDAMVDQMTEIENVQTLWLELLQHGISSRRKRQNLHFDKQIEATEDNQDKVDPNTNKIAVHPIQVKVKYWGETGIEPQVAQAGGDNRKKRQSLERQEKAATQDDNEINNI